MKKILFVLLLLLNFNTVNAMEAYDEDIATTNIVDDIKEDIKEEEPTIVERDYDDIKPEYREEEMGITLYTGETEEQLEEDMIKITAVDTNLTEDNKDMIIYGLATTTLIASGLAVYFYKRNKK